MTSVFKSAAGERSVLDRYRALLRRWPVPNRQFHVPTRAGDTFVIASGADDAPALVLLHGSSFNSVTWMGDVEDWAKHFRVYAVDVIGQPGLSAPSRPSYASAAYAEWLDDVLRGLGIERASFVGLSLGGWLVIDYATRRPERVARLVLICPGGVGRELLSMLKVLLVVLPLMALGAWGRRKAAAILLGPGPSIAADPRAQPAVELMSLVFRHFRQNLEKVVRFGDETLAGLHGPALLVVGARDAVIDSAETRDRLTRAMPGLEVRWLPEAGHAITGQTAPIRDFLLRHEGASTAA